MMVRSDDDHDGDHDDDDDDIDDGYHCCDHEHDAEKG
jgi:hypothetical protein